MKGKLIRSILGALLAHALLLFHGSAMAYSSSAATLGISTIILPKPPPVLVQTFNAKKEVLAVYEIASSTVLEKVQILSMMEEAKGDTGQIKIISVAFN